MGLITLRQLLDHAADSDFCVPAFNINNIEISKPFEIKFDKNEVLDEGFEKAFFELISSIVKSTDQIKIDNVKINKTIYFFCSDGCDAFCFHYGDYGSKEV